MGAYAYCECGYGMKTPTIREAALGVQNCPGCGQSHHVRPEELADRLADLEARIEALESRNSP
jgi:hypothetical protein